MLSPIQQGSEVLWELVTWQGVAARKHWSHSAVKKLSPISSNPDVGISMLTIQKNIKSLPYQDPLVDQGSTAKRAKCLAGLAGFLLQFRVVSSLVYPRCGDLPDVAVDGTAHLARHEDRWIVDMKDTEPKERKSPGSQ